MAGPGRRSEPADGLREALEQGTGARLNPDDGVSLAPWVHASSPGSERQRGLTAFHYGAVGSYSSVAKNPPEANWPALDRRMISFLPFVRPIFDLASAWSALSAKSYQAFQSSLSDI